MTARAKHSPKVALIVGGFVLVTSTAQETPVGGASLETREIRPCNILLPDGGVSGTYASNLWPDGIVPYEFDANVSPGHQQDALNAMAEIEAVSLVDFVPRDAEPNYLHIQDSSGNNSYVGMQGGGQIVNIHSWSSRFIIVHELMHALGLYHEQQRPDRDQYVQIETQNICQDCCGDGNPCNHNFDVEPAATAHGPYDFDSVMHYRECAWSSCGLCSANPDACRTITVLPPNHSCQDHIGQRDYLSSGDVFVLQALYGPDTFETVELTASDAAAVDQFGFSVSVSGDTAVVGARLDDCAAGLNCGSAYVFRFNGSSWVQEQKLTASDAAAEDWFGFSVSVSGNTAVVGAVSDDCAAGIDCGSAYVFRFNGTSWIEEQKLTASDAAASDGFGVSVSVSGDTAVAGALFDDCAAGFNCGSAYVFRFNGTSWVQEQKLTASDAAAVDWFGECVSVSGDTAVVGAYRDDCAAGIRCGAAYVFRFNGSSWVQEQKLTASDAAAENWFGYSVSVSGNTAVVGAVSDDCAAGIACGSGYVFRFNGTSWIEEQKLTASDAAEWDFFGSSVSVSGDTAVAGALFDDCAAGLNCGSAYVFRFNGTSWVQEQKLTASDAVAVDGFGRSVSVSGDTAMVGANFADCVWGRNCGSAYVYTLAAPFACDALPGNGDSDDNGTIDLDDYAAFQACLTGPDNPLAPGCEFGDMDGDGDLDLKDVAAFQIAFDGP